MTFTRKNKRLLIVSLILMGVFTAFFYRFSRYGVNDYKAHYEFALKMSLLNQMSLKEFLEQIKFSHIISYPGWHIEFLVMENFFRVINVLLDMEISSEGIYNLSVAIVNGFCIISFFLVVLKIFDFYIGDKKSDTWKLRKAIAFLFVGPLYIPGLFEGYYMGVKTGNIWHNPTFLIVKPVAVYLFFLYVQILENNKMSENVLNKKLLRASILLVLSAILKPSFFQMFVPALFMWCVLELIRSHGKRIRFLIKIGLSVLPVLCVALVQMSLSLGQEGKGIGVAPFKVWGIWVGNLWFIAFCLSLTFPIVVFLCVKNRVRKNLMVELGIFSLISGCVQYIVFYIKQSPEAGDFGWGFSLSVAIVFVVAYIQKEINLRREQKRICDVIFYMHLFCGVIYFMNIFVMLDYRLPLYFVPIK